MYLVKESWARASNAASNSSTSSSAAFVNSPASIATLLVSCSLAFFVSNSSKSCKSSIFEEVLSLDLVFWVVVGSEGVVGRGEGVADKRSPTGTTPKPFSAVVRKSHCSSAGSFLTIVEISSCFVTSDCSSAIKLIRFARLRLLLVVTSTRSLSTLSFFPDNTSATEDSPVNFNLLASFRFFSLSNFAISSAIFVLNGSSSSS